MSNIKDKVTTIAGLTGALCTAVLAINGLPEVIHVTAAGLLAVSVALIGYFNGKNADGTTKNL